MEKEKNLADVEEKAFQIRDRRNITQRELARELHISPSYVCNWENGYNELNLKTLNLFCNYFDVSIDYMFGFSKEIHQDIIKVEKINLKLLGSHLKEIRKELTYTQEKIAKKLNISRSFYASYENGSRMIKTGDLKQICELAGYSADWCVGKLDYPLRYPPIKKIQTKTIKEIIHS